MTYSIVARDPQTGLLGVAVQAAGSDARGMMAAALVVVEAELRDWWAGRLVDLRVDRSDAPLAELRRLLDASEAYAGFSRAVGALFSGDVAAAVASADEGLSMLPGEENLRFVHNQRGDGQRAAQPRCAASPAQDGRRRPGGRHAWHHAHARTTGSTHTHPAPSPIPARPRTTIRDAVKAII